MAFRYSALDVAAYFKWSSLPQEAEPTYLDFLYQLKNDILARPLTKTSDLFRQAVFREMYHVWSRGFENEFSDVNCIVPEGTVTLFCDQKFLALESYMKLLAIHLLVSANLPFIRIRLLGLPMLLGVDGSWEEYQDNLNKAAEALDLTISNESDQLIDLNLQMPVDPIHIALRDTYREMLFGKGSKRKKLYHDYREKMQYLQEQSILEKKKLDDELHKKWKERKRKTPAGKANLQFELFVGTPENVRTISKEISLSSLLDDAADKKTARKRRTARGVSNLHLEITSDEPVPPPAITHIVNSVENNLPAESGKKKIDDTKKDKKRKAPDALKINKKTVKEEK